MKKVLFLFLLVAGIQNDAFSQFGEFVELRDGTIIKGNIEINERLFKKSQMIINDSITVYLSDVEAYQDGSDYFKRIHKGYTQGTKFARRTETGNIDLYERFEFSYSPGYSVPGPFGTSSYVPGGSTGSNRQYFSKDGGRIYVANAINLKRELTDNPISMSMLNKREGLTFVQVIGAITGITIGVVSISNQMENDEFNGTGLVFGAGVLAGSMWIPYFKKQSLTREAIEAYNHPERFEDY